MNVEEIRSLLGGHGTRQYSNEISRTDLGVAWYDGKFRVGDANKDEAVFFGWKDMSVEEGREIIKKYK